MSRNLPEELVPVLAKLDQHWPQADEDGLRRAAGIWREFGTEAERLARRGGDSAQRVTGENSGPAVDAFAQHWGGFAGGGRGYLDDARTAAEHLATAFDKAATAAEHCKAELISVLTELAAEIKKSEDDQAKAASAAKDAGTGLVGLVGKAIGTVHETAAKAAETGALEVAKLKVAGLLHELGREMKDGLKAALDEPAVITLERIAQADGQGPEGKYRTMSAGGGGQFTGALGGTVVAGAATVGGVRTLSVAVGPDGEPEVVGPDGKPVKGVKGLKVELDASGQPVVVGPDGQPVSGLATGLDGKPLKDASGRPLLVGADGSVGTSGLTVEVGLDGQPKLGPDGRPVLLGADGNPVGVLGTDKSGRPLGAVDLSTDPNGQNLSVKTAAGPAADIQAGPGGATAQASSPARSWGGGGGDGGGHGHGEGWGSGGDSYGGQSGSGYRQVTTQVYTPDNSYNDTPAPSAGHHGPVSVQTDSIAVAPPDTSAVDASPVGGGGGGGLRGEPAFGGSSPAGGDASGGFQLGPVGGGAPAGPPVGAPVAAPVGGPVGTPVGTPVGGPVATGAPVPGTPAPGGAPIAGGPAVGGAGGSAGPVAVGVGVGPVPGGAVPRTPAGSGVPGSVGGGIGSGGGAAGQAGPFPVRVGPDPIVDLRRRMDLPGEGGPSSSPAALGLIPGGLIGGYYIAQALRRPGAPDDAAELPTIADSRPYGVPGGLGPVDPAHQAETVRRVPVQEDDIPVPHPDPRAADWAEALNGGGPREPGRANNCVDIALSAVDTFAGHPTCAAPRLPDGPAGERGGRDRAERELGTRFQDLGDGATAHQKLAQVLKYVGPGAQAMLLTLDEYGRTHSWNVVNHEGVLTYLDHQTARQSGEPLYPADHGLWAIALDAECRPLDLTDVQLVATAPKSKAEPKPEPTPAPNPEPTPAPVAEAEPAPTAPPRSRLTMHRTPAGQRSTSR